MPTYKEAQKLEAVHKILANITDDELLEALKDERELFTRSSKAVMKVMIDELIRRKVYPANTPEGNPNDIYTMVSGWGAYWHIWKGTLECPHCKADLRDHKMGPPGLRQIGMVDRGLDRITHWVCPDCKGTWEWV
jgi:hypothetical protein